MYLHRHSVSSKRVERGTPPRRRALVETVTRANVSAEGSKRARPPSAFAEVSA